jgi:hypothetical protein
LIYLLLFLTPLLFLFLFYLLFLLMIAIAIEDEIVNRELDE